MKVKYRIRAGWRNLRDISVVVCDKRVPVDTKGKVYRTDVRPAMLYAIDTVALKKTNLTRMVEK